MSQVVTQSVRRSRCPPVLTSGLTPNSPAHDGPSSCSSRAVRKAASSLRRPVLKTMTSWKAMRLLWRRLRLRSRCPSAGGRPHTHSPAPRHPAPRGVSGYALAPAEAPAPGPAPGRRGEQGWPQAPVASAVAAPSPRGYQVATVRAQRRRGRCGPFKWRRGQAPKFAQVVEWGWRSCVSGPAMGCRGR